MLTRIKVEVHCLQPRWADVEKCSYRLYLNDELMTERTWVWDINTWIEEQMLVEVDKNINRAFGSVVFSGFTFNGLKSVTK